VGEYFVIAKIIFRIFVMAESLNFGRKTKTNCKGLPEQQQAKPKRIIQAVRI